MQRLIGKFWGLLVALAILPSPAAAQGVSVSFTNGRSNSTNGLADLLGIHATLVTPLRKSAWSMRYGASFLRGSQDVTDRLWTDIPSQSPPIELLNQQRRLITMSAGIGHFAFRDSPILLHTYTDVTAGLARKLDRSVVRGESQQASKATAGFRVGAEAHWTPSKTSPFSILTGLSLEGVKPLPLSECADCWAPFDGGFSMSRLYAGLVIGSQTIRRGR